MKSSTVTQLSHSRGKLTQGSVGIQLIRLVLPTAWGMFAVVAFNLVDTYFVGQLGTEALAAISFTFPVVTTLTSLFIGLGTGAAAVVSQAIGAADRSRARRLSVDSLLLSLGILCLLVCLGLNTIDPLFSVLGAEPDLLPLIHDYMEIWYWGMACVAIPMVGNSLLRSAGNALGPSLIMTVAVVVNLFLDPLLIFGRAGLPALGITGAALATVMARAITLIAVLLVLYHREQILSFSLPTVTMLWQSWRQILHVGLPAMATGMMMPVFTGVIMVMVAAYGAIAIAGFGIALRIEAVIQTVLMALSVGLSPFVGQNWGAQNYARIGRASQLCYWFCLGWGGLAAVALGLARTDLVGGFNTDPAVIAISATYLAIVPISYAAVGAVLVVSALLNASGHPRAAMVINLSRMFGLCIPLAYLGSQILGIKGIFAAVCLSNIVVAVGAVFYTQHIPQLLSTK